MLAVVVMSKERHQTGGAPKNQQSLPHWARMKSQLVSKGKETKNGASPTFFQRRGETILPLKSTQLYWGEGKRIFNLLAYGGLFMWDCAEQKKMEKRQPNNNGAKVRLTQRGKTSAREF